ncbi:MAG: NAD(P)/FAD-dependent oxidoreductase [Pseudomonadota bacterium]
MNEQTGRDIDVVIVGAGFAGLYAIYKLRSLGFSVQAYERGTGVGGTWYWNRYPGARCDAPSMQYSYQFSEQLQQEWEWPEKYSSQPEILRYLNHVADRFDLRPHIQLETSVEAMNFDETSNRWQVKTNRGETVSAQHCVLATGCLSIRKKPDFTGLDDFAGDWYQTSAWPHEPVDFDGQRVGVIGTGSSGIQAIPEIAKSAKTLKVFQRTAQFSTPAGNGPMDREYEAKIKSEYRAFRERNNRLPLAMDIRIGPSTPKTFDVNEQARRARYEECWGKGGLALGLAFRDSSLNPEANEAVSDFIRSKIDEIVKDPATAQALKPKHIYGCKRPCIDTNYYETFNLEHVSLVDVSEGGVECVTANGLIANGEEHELDVIVFATGFDAITGAINQIEISGRGALLLSDKWSAGPRNYLGLNSADFPNLFTVSGPGSPSVLTNMVPTIEQHVNWISQCVAYMRDNGFSTLEAEPQAESDWRVAVQQAAERTLWLACDNWYQGANIPGKPRVFMPYPDWPSYLQKCEDVVAKGYEGFTLR